MYQLCPSEMSEMHVGGKPDSDFQSSFMSSVEICSFICSQKEEVMGTPGIRQILYLAQPRPVHSSSVCFYLQLLHHFFTSSEMFSFLHTEFVAGCLRHNSIFCLGLPNIWQSAQQANDQYLQSVTTCIASQLLD